MATPGGSHPGRTGGEQSSRQQNDRERGVGGSGRDVSNPFDSRLRNPRYTKKKAKAYEATMSNLAQVGGTVLGAMSGPIGTAVNTAAQTIAGVDPMNPFEKPVGTTDSFEYDKGAPSLEEPNKPDVAKLAPPKPKKRKPVVKGFTLLDGVEGTILGS